MLIQSLKIAAPDKNCLYRKCHLDTALEALFDESYGTLQLVKSSFFRDGNRNKLEGDAGRVVKTFLPHSSREEEN